MLSIGVIGLGGVSRFYIDALARAKDLELGAVCDVRQEALQPFAADPAVRSYDRHDRLLGDPRVDAVVIDTPVGTHVELCRAALEAGKHVCCEKPLALTRADAQALLELADARRLTLFTAFHRRYNERLPDPGSLSREGLVAVQVRYLENIVEHTEQSDWYTATAAEGGGCLVDNGPNSFDAARHLFGDVTVEDCVVTRSPQGVDLQAVVRGRAGGADVVIELDWQYAGEVKDIRATWASGEQLHFDMLAGFDGFKSSLYHEYVAVLQDFAEHIAAGRQDRLGLVATAWLEDALTLAAGARDERR
jgi:predicted dehydrogenase